MDAFPLPCVVTTRSTDGYITEQARYYDAESAAQAIRRQHLEVEHAFTSLDVNKVPILVIYAAPIVIETA